MKTLNDLEIVAHNVTTKKQRVTIVDDDFMKELKEGSLVMVSDLRDLAIEWLKYDLKVVREVERREDTNEIVRSASISLLGEINKWMKRFDLVESDLK